MILSAGSEAQVYDALDVRLVVDRGNLEASVISLSCGADEKDSGDGRS